MSEGIGHQSHVTASADDAIDMVADSSEFPVSRGLYVGVTGAANVTLKSGRIVTFAALLGGMVHPIKVRALHAAGTTATGLKAVY